MENMGEICRLCGAIKDDVVFLFGVESAKHHILLKIQVRLDIMISAADPLPKHACVCCLGKLDEIWMFHEECRRTQTSLRKKFVKTLSFPISGTQNIQCEQPETFPSKKSPSMHNSNTEEDFLGGDTINHDLSSPISREGALQDLSGSNIHIYNSFHEDSNDLFGGFEETCNDNSNDKLFLDVCDGERQVKASQDKNDVITDGNVKDSGRNPVVVVERKTSQNKCANSERDDVEMSHENKFRCEEHTSQNAIMETSEMEFGITHLTSVKEEVVTNSMEDSPQGSCAMQEESLTLNAPNLNPNIVPGIGNKFDTDSVSKNSQMSPLVDEQLFQSANAIIDAPSNIIEMDVRVNGIEMPTVTAAQHSPIMDKLPVSFKGFNTNFSSSVERNELCFVDNIVQSSVVDVHNTIPDFTDTFSGKTTFTRSSRDNESINIPTSPAAGKKEEDKEESEKVNILQESDTLTIGNELHQQSNSRETESIIILASPAAGKKEEDEEESEKVNILQESDLVTSGNELDQQSNSRDTESIIIPASLAAGKKEEDKEESEKVNILQESDTLTIGNELHQQSNSRETESIIIPASPATGKKEEDEEESEKVNILQESDLVTSGNELDQQSNSSHTSMSSDSNNTEKSHKPVSSVSERNLCVHGIDSKLCYFLICCPGPHSYDKYWQHTEHGLSCSLCKFFAHYLGKMRFHIQTHLRRKLFKCSICHTAFSDHRCLRKHILLMHDKKTDAGADETHTCNNCNKTFKSKNVLDYHRKRHCNILNERCPDCGKYFTELYRHRLCVPDSFTCDICKKQFNKKGTLTQHINIHMKHYKCDKCDQTFSTRVFLNNHVEHRHGSGGYKCTLCEKSYDAKHQLDTHVLSHTDIRSYLCEICSKSFKHYANLCTHMRFHGKREFKCAQCEKKFFQKNMLLSHMKNIHCRIVSDNILEHNDV